MSKLYYFLDKLGKKIIVEENDIDTVSMSWPWAVFHEVIQAVVDTTLSTTVKKGINIAATTVAGLTSDPTAPRNNATFNKDDSPSTSGLHKTWEDYRKFRQAQIEEDRYIVNKDAGKLGLIGIDEEEREVMITPVSLAHHIWLMMRSGPDTGEKKLPGLAARYSNTFELFEQWDTDINDLISTVYGLELGTTSTEETSNIIGQIDADIQSGNTWAPRTGAYRGYTYAALGPVPKMWVANTAFHPASRRTGRKRRGSK